MRLEIDSTTIRTGDAGSVSGTGAAAGLYGGGSRQAGGAGSGVRDSAQISGVSSVLNSLSAERGARIQQLSAAVRGGTYDVSGAAIAGAIVGEAQTGGAESGGSVGSAAGSAAGG